jgi:hypothetical protein
MYDSAGKSMRLQASSPCMQDRFHEVLSRSALDGLAAVVTSAALRVAGLQAGCLPGVDTTVTVHES